MNNSQLAHVWAQQKRFSGKSNNMFFEERVIYSYGRHFPIATFTDRYSEDGETIVLFNSGSYSNSTARHQSHTREALRGLKVRVFEVPHLDETLTCENMAYFEREYLEAMLKAKRARTRAESYAEAAQYLQHEAKQYAKVYGLDIPKWAIEGIGSAALTAAIERGKKARDAAREMQKLRDAENAKTYDEKLASWLAGGNHDVPYKHDALTCLRVNGENVETSRGACVTLKNARRLYALVRHARGRESGFRENARREMPEIDGFDVRAIDAHGNVTIGCHHLEWSEIERLATVQGWVKA